MDLYGMYGGAIVAIGMPHYPHPAIKALCLSERNNEVSFV